MRVRSAGRGGFGGRLVEALEFGSFGDIPEEKSRAAEDDDDQEGEEEKKEILHDAGSLGKRARKENKKARLLRADGPWREVGVGSGPTEVTAVFGADLDHVALFDEEGDLDG